MEPEIIEIALSEIKCLPTKRNFTKVVTTSDNRYIIPSVTAIATFGPEFYRGKRILNLSVEPEIIQKIKLFEKKVASISSLQYIKSTCRKNFARLHFTPQTEIVDPTHSCRIFSDIIPKEEIIVNLEYQGFWTYGDNSGHHWTLKKLLFLDT